MNFKVSRVQLIGTLFAFALVAGIAAFALASSTTPAAATSGKPVTVSFTKWVTGGGGPEGCSAATMAGVVTRNRGRADSRPTSPRGGTFAGNVCAQIVGTGAIGIIARYRVIDGDETFTALVAVMMDGDTGKAVLNGIVEAGWMQGAHVQGGFDTIDCTEGVESPQKCYTVTLRIVPDSAK